MADINESQWVESIKDFLLSANLGDNIKVETKRKLPYANEITQYDLDFNPCEQQNKEFETDLLIYEENQQIIIPRIVVEAKLNITTHDAITYSNKAQSHKNITPFLRYGIMASGNNSLPPRLFRHGSNFDFMICFKNEKLTESEEESFVELLKKELSYSKQLENIFGKNKENYSVFQRRLFFE
jgi:hypothetical protein